MEVFSWFDARSEEILSWAENHVEPRHVSYVLIGMALLPVLRIAFLLIKFAKKRLGLLSAHGLGIVRTVHEFKKSGIAFRDLLILPEGLNTIRKWANVSSFLLQVGVILLLPSPTRRRYFGESLYIIPSNARDEVDNLMIEVKELLVVPDKLTKLTIIITNHNDKPISLWRGQGGLSHLEKWIRFLFDDRYLEPEKVEPEEVLKGAVLNPSEQIDVSFYFRTVGKALLRKVREATLYLYPRTSNRGRSKEFRITFDVPQIDCDVEYLLRRQIDFTSFFFIMASGGFILIAFVLVLLLFFLFIGGWKVIVIISISVLLFVIALSLNTKWAQIILDILERRT